MAVGPEPCIPRKGLRVSNKRASRMQTPLFLHTRCHVGCIACGHQAGPGRPEGTHRNDSINRTLISCCCVHPVCFLDNLDKEWAAISYNKMR